MVFFSIVNALKRRQRFLIVYGVAPMTLIAAVSFHRTSVATSLDPANYTAIDPSELLSPMSAPAPLRQFGFSSYGGRQRYRYFEVDIVEREQQIILTLNVSKPTELSGADSSVQAYQAEISPEIFNEFWQTIQALDIAELTSSSPKIEREIYGAHPAGLSMRPLIPTRFTTDVCNLATALRSMRPLAYEIRVIRLCTRP